MGISQVPQPSTVTSVTGTAGRVTSSGGTAPAIDLATSGVSGGSYGSANAIPTVTVDTYGRVTSIGTAAVSAGGLADIASGNLSGSTVNLTSIPQNYKSLVLRITAPKQNTTSNNSQIFINTNGNASNSYWAFGSYQGGTAWAGGTSRTFDTGLFMEGGINNNTTLGMMEAVIHGYSTNNIKNVFGIFHNSRAVIGYTLINSPITNIAINTSTINNGGNWAGGTYNLWGVI